MESRHILGAIPVEDVRKFDELHKVLSAADLHDPVICHSCKIYFG